MNEIQKKILAFIAECLRERGLPPTLREIGARCGVSSTGSVAFHLEALEREGFLKRLGSLKRGLQLAQDPFGLPVLGKVGAGGSLLAQENIEGNLSLDKEFLRGGEFLLRVKGDSMTGAGIREGDLVVVSRKAQPQAGDIVVAVVGEEGVVKRLGRQGGRPRLESANPKYAPIVKEFQVVGKVVGLVRKYGR